MLEPYETHQLTKWRCLFYRATLLSRQRVKTLQLLVEVLESFFELLNLLPEGPQSNFMDNVKSLQ